MEFSQVTFNGCSFVTFVPFVVEVVRNERAAVA